LHPELAFWATSSIGTFSARKNYETLETYGDTILKLAATFFAFK
jgi:dsRNA-specific ribonuclease